MHQKTKSAYIHFIYILIYVKGFKGHFFLKFCKFIRPKKFNIPVSLTFLRIKNGQSACLIG
jgi:hypothetical protein